MAHTLTQGRVLLLSILNVVLSEFSQLDTRWTSAPFQVGQSLNPYPFHYRMAFAFSNLSIPHLQQCALRFTCLERRRYGVSTFHINDPMSDLGVFYTPVVRQSRTNTLEICTLTTYYPHRRIIFDLLNLGRSVAVYDAYEHLDIFTISLVPGP